MRGSGKEGKKRDGLRWRKEGGRGGGRVSY